jgi:hypothetical protein
VRPAIGALPSRDSAPHSWQLAFLRRHSRRAPVWRGVERRRDDMQARSAGRSGALWSPVRLVERGHADISRRHTTAPVLTGTPRGHWRSSPLGQRTLPSWTGSLKQAGKWSGGQRPTRRDSRQRHTRDETVHRYDTNAPWTRQRTSTCPPHPSTEQNHRSLHRSHRPAVLSAPRSDWSVAQGDTMGSCRIAVSLTSRTDDLKLVLFPDTGPSNECREVRDA